MKKYNFNVEEEKLIITEYCENCVPMYKIAKQFNVDISVIKRILEEKKIKVINGSPFSFKYWVKRGFSQVEAKQKVKEFKPSHYEYWMKIGFTKNEAKEKILNHLMNNKNSFIEKYGEEKGTLKWSERKLNDGKYNSRRSIHYWIKRGFSQEEAKVKVSESQITFSKEICIKKYGKEKGLKMFSERQKKWSDSLINNGNLKMGYSKISQELFYKLLESYNFEDKKNIKFATHNGEYKLEKENGGYWFYDFTDLKNKKIIEYNGDMFHGNPKKYNKNESPHPFDKTILAEDMWKKDAKKNNVVKENGFDILIIWDSEYRWGNKEKVIKKCIKFLKNGKDNNN
jgi:hypothetical protein